MARSFIHPRKKTNLALGALHFFAVVAASPLFFMSVQHVQAACADPPGRGIDWQECRKTSVMMNGMDLAESNFEKSNLSSSDLRGARLIGSNFSKSNLVRASLADVNASNANFSGVVAARTDFSGGIFKNSNFFKAEITRADFSGATLENSDLSKGQFSRVNFKDASLNKINLDFTSLARSDLRGVNFDGPVSMHGTFLFRTHLEGLDLNKITGLQSWQLELACGDETTIVPDGLTRPTRWPCSNDNDG